MNTYSFLILWTNQKPTEIQERNNFEAIPPIVTHTAECSINQARPDTNKAFISLLLEISITAWTSHGKEEHPDSFISEIPDFFLNPVMEKSHV